MLRELHISNLAVISDAKIELGPGLNCFTGATGAGKSLIIGAVELLLGLRSVAEMLRTGAQEGRVSGVFDMSAAVLRRIEEAGDISLDADGREILITRRLHASGRSSISLNGNPITLGMLKQIAEHLVDVHGQHDHQFLLKPANQLEMLDHFASLQALREEYRTAYVAHGEAKRRVEELAASRSLRQQQLELYQFQAEEIDKAEISAGEFEELSARSSVLRNLEKLKKEAGAVHGALYEMDGSVLERLKMMAAVLSELTMVDQLVAPIAQSMREATIQLEETAFDLSRYLDRLELDPGELAEVDERLNVLNRVLHKYGGSSEVVLAYREEIGKKIQELSKESEDLGCLRKKLEPLQKEMTKLGEKLSAARKSAAKNLTPLVEKELAELGMEKAKFNVAFEKSAEPIAGGIDQIEFVAQTNPGQSAQPLRKIASGGELSRIMLALKGILAQTDGTSVLVFDEIDANVGGRLGSVIGMKLRQLAAHHQVLCITHLPQIACFADWHLTVKKSVAGGKTETSVRLVSGVERIEELAEMIGGQRVSDVTRAQAEELLAGAGSNGKTRKRVKAL
ncbi:MAG TPA: DNA repair protein RecN [Tepidisphaeraceae bacterium]|jgi:DNA repair protein RecN (Recombination protein N)|nr:DNA repair protein RecN [Tepidisphaeraceae bacterium]